MNLQILYIKYEMDTFIKDLYIRVMHQYKC